MKASIHPCFDHKKPEEFLAAYLNYKRLRGDKAFFRSVEVQMCQGALQTNDRATLNALARQIEVIPQDLLYVRPGYIHD